MIYGLQSMVNGSMVNEYMIIHTCKVMSIVYGLWYTVGGIWSQQSMVNESMVNEYMVMHAYMVM